MERLGRLTAVLATAMLTWLEPLSCRAQSSGAPTTTAPPVRQSPATKTAPAAPEETSRGAKSTTRVPPPRPWPLATSPATPEERPPAPEARVSPAVDSAVIRRAQDVPPPRAARPVPPPAPIDKLTVQLKSAPLEPTDVRFPINLATALRL